MASILPFKRTRLSEKHKGKSLCREGFHKWKINQNKQFDVRQGKLVTVYVCERCGQRKTSAQ